MHSRVSISGKYAIALLGANFALTSFADDSSPLPRVTIPVEQIQWRKAILAIPTPNRGCFKGTYPTSAWVPVPCTPPPIRKLPSPLVAKPRTGDVGGSNTADFSAQVPMGLIGSAQGSFDTFTTTGEINKSAGPNGVFSRKSEFMLQMNSNLFSTNMCKSAPNAAAGSCMAWEQFFLTNDPGSPPTQAWIQYWLLGWGRPCPAAVTVGTGSKAFSDPWQESGTEDCHLDTPGVNLPTFKIQDMANTIMLAKTAGGIDSVIISGPTEFFVSSFDSVLNLASNWEVAEFNVFGDLSKHQAIFDAGTRIVVRVETQSASGAQIAPVAVMKSFTGETNNLNLVSPACAIAAPFFAVTFKETNIAGETFPCTNPTPPDLCKDATEAVAADQKALTNAMNALHTPRCQGPASLNCEMVVKAIQQRLQADETEKQKACH